MLHFRKKEYILRIIPEVTGKNKLFEELQRNMTGKELVLKAVFEKAFSLMDSAIAEKLAHDETYLTDERDSIELEQKYESLSLSSPHRMIIEDFHACNCSRFYRMIELAYQAGAETALSIIEKQVAPCAT